MGERGSESTLEHISKERVRHTIQDELHPLLPCNMFPMIPHPLRLLPLDDFLTAGTVRVHNDNRAVSDNWGCVGCILGGVLGWCRRVV